MLQTTKGNGDLIDGSDGTDYGDFLRNIFRNRGGIWESIIGTIHQDEYETVTKYFTVDYLSNAYRDILVTEEGSFTQRYVYAPNGTRISAEFDYIDETPPNFAIIIAINDIQKIWFRNNYLGSSLIALTRTGNVISHTIFDAWGNPLTATYPDANYSGIDNRNNPTDKRFTQEDPINDGWNWYIYCANNPIGNIDPSGLFGLNTELRIGSRGSDVRLLQRALLYLGFPPNGGVDGSYGTGTQTAVNNFKTAYMSSGTNTESGYVGIKTWSALMVEIIKKMFGWSYFPPVLSCNLSIGSTGDDVVALQRALAMLGRSTLPDATGRFSIGTLRAVNAYKIANNLGNSGAGVEGVVGPATWLHIITALGMKALEDRVTKNYVWPVPASDTAPSGTRNGERSYLHSNGKDAADLFANPGRPVLAITSGTLIRVVNSTRTSRDDGLYGGWNGYRATLQLYGDDGYTYFYTHLTPDSPQANGFNSIGSGGSTRVNAGQQLGTIGDRAAADYTNPHLHISSAQGRGVNVDQAPSNGVYHLAQEILPRLYANR